MRCPECGFVNDPSAKICIKCGTKVRGAEEPPRVLSSPGSGKATVMGQVSNVPSWDDPQEAPRKGAVTPEPRQNASQKCEKCGHYPVIADANGTTCPNCGTHKPKESRSNPVKDSHRDTTVLPNNKGVDGSGFKLTEVQSGNVHPFSGPSPLNVGKPTDITAVVGNTGIEIQKTQNTWSVVVNIKPGSTILIGNTFYRFDPE